MRLNDPSVVHVVKPFVVNYMRDNLKQMDLGDLNWEDDLEDNMQDVRIDVLFSSNIGRRVAEQTHDERGSGAAAAVGPAGGGCDRFGAVGEQIHVSLIFPEPLALD